MGVGVGGEQLGQLALLGVFSAQSDEHVQCVVHGIRIHTVGDAELESSLIGLGLLTARVGVLGQLLSEVAKEAGREGSSGGVDGGDAITGGHHEVSGTVGVAHVFINKVTQLVADDGKDFIVVHGIHQSGVDADATVATGEGVDRVRLIHLVVQVQVLDVVETSHDAVEALGVVVACRQHGVLPVALGHVLGTQLGNLRITDGKCLDCGCAGIHGCIRINDFH